MSCSDDFVWILLGFGRNPNPNPKPNETQIKNLIIYILVYNFENLLISIPKCIELNFEFGF